MSIKCPFAKRKGERRWVRIRAHINPLSNSDQYVQPSRPSAMDWEPYFGGFREAASRKAGVDSQVRIVDVGCGFGGLLEALAPHLPETMILGMEIRQPVVVHVQKRLDELRAGRKAADLWTSKDIPAYSNISVVYTNAMKFLPKFFAKGQLEKMFFCFPDPHFKKANFRRRIISKSLLSEYAYALRVGGLIYNITDVVGLYTWTRQQFDAHPLFEQVSEADLGGDPAIPAMLQTDEAAKVAKRGLPTYHCVYRRIADPYAA